MDDSLLDGIWTIVHARNHEAGEGFMLTQASDEFSHELFHEVYGTVNVMTSA